MVDHGSARTHLAERMCPKTIPFARGVLVASAITSTRTKTLAFGLFASQRNQTTSSSVAYRAISNVLSEKTKSESHFLGI